MCGVEQWFALLVHHPTLGHHFSVLCFGFDFAIRRNCCCHVEHDRRFMECGDGRCDRVGGQEHIKPPPRWEVIGVAHGKVQTQQVVLECHFGVKGGWACMVAVLRAHPSDAGFFCLFDGQFGGVLHHQMPHCIVTIDERHGGLFFDHLDFGVAIDCACFDALGVRGQAENAMPIRALHIGLCHQLRNDEAVIAWKAQGHHGVLDKAFKRREFKSCMHRGVLLCLT